MQVKANYTSATLDETREFLKVVMKLPISHKERGLTAATIINHLAKLHKERGGYFVAHPGEEVVEQVRRKFINA